MPCFDAPPHDDFAPIAHEPKHSTKFQQRVWHDEEQRDGRQDWHTQHDPSNLRVREEGMSETEKLEQNDGVKKLMKMMIWREDEGRRALGAASVKRRAYPQLIMAVTEVRDVIAIAPALAFA